MAAARNPKLVAEKARAIYESRIRPAVERDHAGESLVIEAESGEYEVHPDEDTAFQRLEARRPAGTFYVMRVGSPYSQFVGAPVE